jgi:antibiotic biosynthesis monooxygenase (ABM) superfamily enzyme
MAILTGLAAYPVTTALLFALGSPVEHLPLAARTLLVTAVIVPLMTYAVMPVMTRLFARWLYSKPSESSGWVERPTRIGVVPPDDTSKK